MVTKRSTKKAPAKKVKKTKKVAKKVAKKKRSRKPRGKPRGGDEITQADIEIEIWTSYAKLQSIVLVSEATGHSYHVVRSTLAADRRRLDRIKQDQIELAAAKWELQRNEALGMLTRTLRMYLGDLVAIEQAVREGRTLTKIRGEDGIELPVLHARELMVKSRMVDQFIKLGAQAEATAASLRKGCVPAVGSDTAASGEAELTDPAKMNDLQLYNMIKRLENPTETMKLKAERFEKQQAEKMKKLDKI